MERSKCVCQDESCAAWQCDEYEMSMTMPFMSPHLAEGEVLFEP